MVTVQNIFDMAMDLMDEADADDGSTSTMDTTEYKFRTISILNAGIQILYPYSSNYDRYTENIAGRPMRPDAATLFQDSRKAPEFDQEIPLDDTLALGLLPFYLASFLRATEDMDFSNRMMSEFNRAFIQLRDTSLAEFEQITPRYGLF